MSDQNFKNYIKGWWIHIRSVRAPIALVAVGYLTIYSVSVPSSEAGRSAVAYYILLPLLLFRSAYIIIRQSFRYHRAYLHGVMLPEMSDSPKSPVTLEEYLENYEEFMTQKKRQSEEPVILAGLQRKKWIFWRIMLPFLIFVNVIFLILRRMVFD